MVHTVYLYYVSEQAADVTVTGGGGGVTSGFHMPIHAHFLSPGDFDP